MEADELALVRRADDARSTVAIQLMQLITESGMTGSTAGVAAGVQSLLAAERSGDLAVRRAAAMEVALAAANYAVHLDLQPAISNGTLRA